MVFLSLCLFKEFSFKEMTDSSFLWIIPGSERPLSNKNIVVNKKRIIINIMKKVLIFV